MSFLNEVKDLYKDAKNKRVEDQFLVEFEKIKEIIKENAKKEILKTNVKGLDEDIANKISRKLKDYGFTTNVYHDLNYLDEWHGLYEVDIELVEKL